MVLSKMSVKEFYLIEFKINHLSYYTFWYTDDVDGFLLAGKDRIKTFKNFEEAKCFADEYDFKLNDEAIVISYDDIKKANLQAIDCNSILTFWNIITDIAQSVKCQFIGDRKEDEITDVYSKLFYGCNLPAVKQEGEEFMPQWNEEEKTLIEKVIENGYQILTSVLA